MNQEIEIEFKNLLTSSEFYHLCNVFSISDDQFFTQENHYFDTEDFSLKNKQSALRIRKKEKTYTLTLKQPNEVGKLETHQTLTEQQAQEMLNGNTFINGEVEEIIHGLGIHTSSIQYLGTLKTHRAEIEYNGGTLVFDHSQYLGIDDYELEYEVTDEAKGKKQFLNLLQQHNIEIKHTDNKIKRFFIEKQRQQ